DLGELLTWVSTVCLAVVLAASAGLRAWLPLLITALLARFELLRLGESFEFLASTPALVLFSLATAIEIVGDKIPAVDHVLDLLSTVVRPAAGALLAAAVMWKIDDPLVASVLGLVVGAPTAFAPHAAKSTVRATSTVTTGGLANPVLSTGEDLASAGLALLGVVLPIFALLLLLAALGYVLWRTRRKIKPGAAT